MRRLTVLLTAMVAAIVLVSGVALSQTAPPVSPQYTVKDLGTLGGSFPSSYAFGINDRDDSGQVQVVGVSYRNLEPEHAFLYSGGRMHDLGTLDGDTSSFAWGINDSGEVVGYSEGTSPDRPLVHRAFLYSGGQMQALGPLDGGATTLPYAEARNINDSGEVVGYSDVPFDAESITIHAFLYSGGRMHDLGTLDGGYSSIANDINDFGQVVGESTTSSGTIFPHAFLYSGGRMQDLGTLGGTFSRAWGINNSGQVVGYADNSSRQSRAFLYSGDVMQNLGTLDGGNSSKALGINDSGQVVGESTTSAGPKHAILYSDGQMHDLNTLIPADSGWVLREAWGINTSGDIVGMGDLSGQTRAFLATANTTNTGDTTPPQLNLPNSLSQSATSPNGAPVSYTATATDDVDGDLPVDCSPASGSTFPLGITTVNCSAEDAAGNVATGSFEVRVVFDFGNGSGGSFGQPIRDTELNQLAAGAAVPVKFGLGADYGLNIFAEGYPKSTAIDCPGMPTAVVGETSTVSKSGLTYDAASGLYTYVWKTDRAWKGTCRELNVKLADGTDHLVKFEFK